MSVVVGDWEDFRRHARRAINAGVPPTDIDFACARSHNQSLFGACDLSPRESISATSHIDDPPLAAPKRFVELAALAALYRDEQRWNSLYRLLFRIVAQRERHLLEITTDDDVMRLRAMHKAVKRDAHKMTAFVRFRKITVAGVDHYIAWHRPDHYIVRHVAPFFRDRFASMNFAIWTPDDSVAWNGVDLTFGPGVARSQAPAADELEDLWRTYYRSIYNPARTSVRAMKREMPVRHWATLPEAETIVDLLNAAPQRVGGMLAEQTGFAGGAADWLPAERGLPQLRAAAATCRACPLCDKGTQTVFGVGPACASIALVGEQPGDEEDRAGAPFVGPAGQVLNAALAEVGIDRQSVYVTNAVKHFSHTISFDPHAPTGKRRLHQRPTDREVQACKPWLLAELLAVQPTVLVCLGHTAARAVIGVGFDSKLRGIALPTPHARHLVATYHPAALLRAPAGAKREQMLLDFHRHLAFAKQLAT